MMFAFVGIQLVHFNRMTTGTEPRRNETVVGDPQGLVGLVTQQAVLITHIIDMRIVTLLTFEKLSVLRVTFFAVKQRMTAGIILKLPPLVGMTGTTGRRGQADPGKRDIQRSMGRMATETVSHCKMRVVYGRMTHRTCRDDLSSAGRMVEMAALTGYRGLMLAAMVGNIFQFAYVTLLTVFVRQVN
jgi:hypothetical protein